jgi:hypothetical protein
MVIRKTVITMICISLIAPQAIAQICYESHINVQFMVNRPFGHGIQKFIERTRFYESIFSFFNKQFTSHGMFTPSGMSKSIIGDVTDIAADMRGLFPINPRMGIINEEILALAAALMKRRTIFRTFSFCKRAYVPFFYRLGFGFLFGRQMKEILVDFFLGCLSVDTNGLATFTFDQNVGTATGNNCDPFALVTFEIAEWSVIGFHAWKTPDVFSSERMCESV